MAEVIIDYLEQSADKYPKKPAYIDQYESVTYEELRDRTYKIACQLIRRGYEKSPIAIYVEKSVQCIAMMLGVLYSGNFYTVLDVDMPPGKIKKILSVFSPVGVIVDKKYRKQLEEIKEQYDFLSGEDLLVKGHDSSLLEEKRKHMRPTDLSQVVFTSGSTGMAKGVMLSHSGIISLMESKTKYFRYNESDIFANQFPFHFVAHLEDIFCTLKTGATDYIIPKELFFSPKHLIKFIEEKKVTILFWASPALCLVAKYGALSNITLPHVRMVAFGGEVMSTKYLHFWKKALPKIDFFNVYGSSETGSGVLCYKVNRVFRNQDSLPLGFPIGETDIFIIDENGKSGQMEGELCVKSKQLAVGYYKNAEETAKKFVQMRDKSGQEVTVFKTGDLVKYNEYGELVYLGRKDFQFKRHGYRIEPGEIEYAVNALEGIKDAACVYDRQKEKIILFYSGDIDDGDLRKSVKKTVPHYMLPDIYIRLGEIPRNVNRKIDREKLRMLYEENGFQ